MYQCMYLSRITRTLSVAELELLQSIRHENNLKSGITGALVMWNGCFLQLLEGEAGAVQRTYARIRQDTRHTEVEELLKSPTPERRFDDSSMRLIDFNDPSTAVRVLIKRHPPLSLMSSYYRDPMLAFAFLYDVRYHLRLHAKAA